MPLIYLAVLLIVSGIVLAAVRTLRRGRLSEPRPRGGSDTPDTLEPSGRGRRLSLKSDWPGLVLIGLGFALLLASAAFRT